MDDRVDRSSREQGASPRTLSLDGTPFSDHTRRVAESTRDKLETDKRRRANQGRRNCSANSSHALPFDLFAIPSQCSLNISKGRALVPDLWRQWALLMDKWRMTGGRLIWPSVRQCLLHSMIVHPGYQVPSPLCPTRLTELSWAVPRAENGSTVQVSDDD